MTKKRIIERYAYKNTSSSKGQPTLYKIKIKDIKIIFTWTNFNGNPSYVFHMNDGTTYYLVDDYAALNDIHTIIVQVVNRKKDMF